VHDGELLLPLKEEWDRELASADPLEFPGYAEALAAAPGESIRTGLVVSQGVRAVLIQSDFDIFGGTMGAVAGEQIVRSFRRAVDLRLPVVAVTRTGGARMQEGMAALIQMPRTVVAADEHARSGLLSAIVYRSPTTGGVYASWASLLDVRAAEPHATLGFAGPRVVRQVTGEAPPAWSHTAESAYQAGLVDALIERTDQVAWVDAVLGSTDWPLTDADLGRIPPTVPNVLPSSAHLAIRQARSRSRPSGLEWASALCSSWVELKGQDPSIRVGLARVLGERVVVVAMDRYADGIGAARPGPAAYRLARRAIGLADAAYARRHAWRRAGTGRRTRRHCGRDRHHDPGHVPAAHAERMHMRGRGRQRRRHGPGSRRPPVHAAELRLLGHQPGGCRHDLVPRRVQGGRTSRSAPADQCRTDRPGYCRRCTSRTGR